MFLSTGQKLCYGPNGEAIPCEGSGQDGECCKAEEMIERGRFRSRENMVLDALTGLEWTRDASVTEFPLPWDEAFDFIRNMNDEVYSGHSDWRLPNRRELFSLVSHTKINPALDDGHLFENVFSGYYWTSTTCSRFPKQAWYVHFGGARVQRGMKHGSYMVWPVRSEEIRSDAIVATGQTSCFDGFGKLVPCGSTCQDGDLQQGIPWPKPRFIERQEEIIDRLTGLSWTRNADLGNGTVNWSEALKTIDSLNSQKLSGRNNWRLPNIRELESLVDLGRHSPALPKHHPFENVRPFYWSSTTSVYDTLYAWTLYLQDGAAGVGYKAMTEFYVWGVR